MKRDSHPVKHDDLEGSEQHHRLKNDPGRKGKDGHADDGTSAGPEMREAVDSSEADTQLADALREAAPEKPDADRRK